MLRKIYTIYDCRLNSIHRTYEVLNIYFLDLGVKNVYNYFIG